MLVGIIHALVMMLIIAVAIFFGNLLSWYVLPIIVSSAYLGVLTLFFLEKKD